MANKDDKKNKKGALRTLMYPLEKRLLLDASTLEATVNAIPAGILNLDAQDIDGDGDFSAADQPNTGDTVQTWRDKFGAGNDASEGTASRRPEYDANAFGTGIGGLNFDGDDTYVIGNQTDINSNGPWPEKSFAFVFRTGTNTSGFQVIFEQGGSTRGYQVSIDGGNIYASGYNNTGSEWGSDRFKIMNLGAVQTNTTYRVIMVFDSNTGDGFIKSNLNGGAFVQLDEVGSQQNHGAAIGIGAEQNGTVRPTTLALTNNSDANFFRGSIGQIMQWNTALDDNQVRAVDSYLTHKWTNSPAIQFNTGDTVLEGGVTNISSSELYTVDRNTTPANLTYQINGYSNGTIERNGITVGINGTFTQEDIDNGIIQFRHDDSETTTASFSYRITDGGTQDTDTFFLNVTPVDDVGSDPPAIINNTVQSVVQNASVNINSAALLISDVDTTAGNLDFTVTSTLNGSVFNTNLAATVTAFTQADIDNGFIRFDQDGTSNGFAGFDFDVTDGTTTISGTKEIGVTFTNSGANDPPVIIVNTGDSLNTGGTRLISNTNLRTTDPDNNINQLVYTITTATNGTVFRNGSALGIGGTFTQADINFGGIQFTHDGSGTTTASIGFNISDGNTTVTGNSYDFGVVINDPPDLGPDPAAVGVFENAADGTFIYNASAFDPEGDSITYSIQSGNGLGIFQINPISGDVTIADNSNLDFEGVNNFALVIRATDDGVGNPFDELTLNINVQNINEDPNALNNTFTILEDTPYNFAASNFGFSDPDDAPASNSLQSVVIVTLPTNGILELSGVAVVAGQDIAAAQIPNLIFTPALNENGATYDSFTFQVRDDGGTANGGVDLDTTPNTITFNVTAVNDAPDGADITVTTDEDTPYNFGFGDFSAAFSDNDDSPSNTALSIIVTTLPADGVLALSGTAITVGQEIAIANIPNISFTPDANENGVGYASFTYQIRDNGGMANGGVDIDPTPNTITVNVNSVNDAPDGADNTITFSEDNVYPFTATDFGFTDANDTPANNLNGVRISTLPAVGTLSLAAGASSPGAVSSGQIISLADISFLEYTPPLNANGTGVADFTFEVQDDGGTANGGVDLDATPNTITFNITAVNDEPAGADNTVSTNEDIPLNFAATDFGFTDTADAPDNFLSVIITTLPANGVLELSGMAITAGQEILVADIPNITFTPTINESGMGYTTFTFQVKDDGSIANGGVDTDQSPNIMTIDVVGINDAPDGADNTISMFENNNLGFTATDFGFTDANDTPANNLLSVIITAIPSNGTLELSGTAVIAGQEILLADIANLEYTPPLNSNGTAFDNFTFQVRDDGGTANGGIDTDTTANTITIDVDPINSEPIGADNTVVTNEDTGFNFAAADFGFTDTNDTPANDLFSVIITTLPVNGSLELSGVAVVAGQEILVADIPNLIFTPIANESGTAYDNFTFQVRDDGGVAGGGVDTDQTASTMTIDVTNINDAPDGADITLTTNEDTALSFTVTDFGFTDVNDAPNNLLSVIITTLPTNGSLELSSVTVTAGQEILVADIPNLSFIPAANANGAAYDSFTFQVRDDGGTPNGGQDTDQTANTVTINVDSVNDAPDGADNTVTTLEDNDYTFDAADFGFTDVNDGPNAFQSVVITTIPTIGTLNLSGTAVTVGQEILVADIPNLTFTPVANANGAAYDNFTFQVRDDGGTPNGGADLDATPNTIIIDVTSVNDAPDGADNTIVILEDDPYTFSDSDFGFTDVNDTPANILSNIIVTSIPANGILELSGVAVTAGQIIAAADIPNLIYTPPLNVNGVASDVFTFQVQDDGGTTDGGIDTDATANTITFDITPVNDAPDGADTTISTIEDIPYNFAATDFGFTDANDTPNDAFLSVIISTLPANGTLELSGTAVTAGQEILVADIPNLTFIPALGQSGTAYDTFTFQTKDDGGTINGGIDTDQTPNTITIDVTAINDAPDGTDNTLITAEDTPLTFAIGDFGFTDTGDTIANNFQSVIITTLPTNGVLELSGIAVTAGQEILVADIPNLSFIPSADANGAAYDNFTFQVRDDGGTANGGIDLDATPNTMTIDVTSVNDTPDGADITLSTLEDTPLVFDAANFGFTDVNDAPNNLLSVIITTIPSNGPLELSGVTVTAGQEILVADIPNLSFIPAANANGAAYDNFTFQVRDDGGTPNGGQDTDQTANTVTINVDSVNDAPDGADNTVTTLEDNDYTFDAADFGFTDVNDSPNAFQSVVISTLPTNGILNLSGTAVTAGQEILVADIPNLTFTPVANANGAAYDNFTFQVRDDGGTPNGGTDLDTTPNTITIDVTSVNDAPDGTDNTITAIEDIPYNFDPAEFGFTDPNDLPPNSLAGVIIASLPLTGTLELSGAAVSAGQVIAAADIVNLAYTPVTDINGTAVADFTFQVQDDDGVLNGGIDTDQTPNTITIDVTSVNDAPDGADATFNVLENNSYNFAPADFGYTDAADSPANILQSVIISTLPASGVLELSGIAVTAGQEILVADIPNLTFSPAFNENGIGYTDFTFQVRDDGGTANGGIDTDQTPNTITFDVDPINSEPEGTDTTVTTLEDNAYIFSDTDFGFIDANDIPANILQSVIINTLPVNGSLELLGVVVTAGQEILASDITNLIFTPLPNANGAAYDSFTFQVRDDGGTANGGIDLDATPNTMNINVTSVNDAPDGADITLSTLEDTPLVFDAANFGFTDVNDAPNNLSSVVITTLPADGILELSGIAVIAGQEILVADISNLTFTPTLNENGAGYTDFTFQVRDDGGVTDGGIDLDPTANTVTINVDSVNDAPDGADNTVTTLEDNDYTFDAADFGFTDAADTPANNFQSVVISTLPTNGTLNLSGTAVTAGQEITVADISNLTFTPVANANGAAYDNFTFQVCDDGGTVDGGVDLDSAANIMTIDVTSVNDEPDGTDTTLAAFEDVPYVFDAANFGLTDINDNPANTLQSVIITTLPADGILELSSVAVVAGQEILASDIPNLTFTAALNEFGTGYADFTFQVRDDDGTLNGGVDLDATPNTIIFDVTQVNDAPDGADITLSTLEDAPLGFTASDFGFTDISDTPANILQSVIVTTLPVNGALELSGVAVTAGQEILVADIPNLSFIPAANSNGAAYDNFTFQVRDDGGTANGGINTDQTANTVTIDVVSVNDAPDGADTTVTTLEDTDYIFDPVDFGFTDVNDNPENLLQSVIISTLPTNGTLNLSGVAVTAGQEIMLADIPNLTFTPMANTNGAAYDNFTFQVRDNGGTTNGGVDLDGVPNTMIIDVTSVNDAPDGADITLTTLEDTPYTFDPANFGFTDVNDTPSNNLQSVIITTLPLNGILELSGAAITAGQEITLADIPNLTFTPSLNDNGLAYTDFTFQVRDDGGTTDGGVDLDGTANTITFDVTSVNDEPDGTDVTVSTNENIDYVFDATDFGFTDINDTPANAFASVIITTLPTIGVLELSGMAVTAGQEILLANIPNLTFTPVTNENGPAYADFIFQVRDDGGTADGGIDLDANPNTITIDVVSVNNAPEGTDVTLTTNEDIPYVFSVGDFGYSDPNDTPSDTFDNVIITTLPLDGLLELSGVAVTAGQVVAVADIPNLTYTPTINENGAAYASFAFQVQDDGGIFFAGVDTDQSPNTITFDILSVNDEPEGADLTVTTLEDTDYGFTAADFGITDINDTPTNVLQSVIINTLPLSGVLNLSGVAVTAGQEILVSDIATLSFSPIADENGTGYANFTFQVRDDGGTANGGIDLDAIPNTITIDVTPVDDAPILVTNNTITLLEGDTEIIDIGDLSTTDIDTADADLVYIVTTPPVNGFLALTSAPTVSISTFTQDDIANNRVTYVHDGTPTTSDSFDFTVQDNLTTLGSDTFNINIVTVNDAPEGTDNTLTTFEDTPLNFSATDFGFSDPADIPANNLEAVIISVLPSSGVLELSGIAVIAGQEIALADIPNLTFTPALNSVGLANDSFTFQVRDDGGLLGGGIDTDQSPNTITIDVTSVNDAPDGTDTTVTTLEDTDYIFDAADFGFTDLADNPANNLQSVIISTLPTNGVLNLSGVAVTAGQEILSADIPNLTFTPVPNANGAAYDNFTFQVRDDGGTADSGIDLDAAPNTITIDVASVNDAPTGADNTLSAFEDVPYVFNAADFGFTDPVDLSANALSSVVITTLPTNGILEISGAAVTAGQEISLANIPNLTFTTNANEFGIAYTDFTFQVRDDGGTADGGIDLDPNPKTITFDVIEVNDAPDGLDNTITAIEDTALNFNVSDFGFIDINDTPADNFVSVIITSLPADGILELSGIAVTAGQEILVADIPNLSFTPASNANGLAYTTFSFQVKDDGGTADGGIDTDQSANIITIDVTPVDDAPTLNVNAGLSTFEGFTETLTTALLSSSDIDTATTDITYTVTTPPINGQLELTSALGVAITTFTQDDLDNNRVTYVHDSSETTSDSFDFTVSDALTNIGTSTFNITITPVNDAPEGVDNTLTTNEDTPLTFNSGDFGFTDPNDTLSNNFQSVIITTLPTSGTLTLSGAAVAAGQEILTADIANLVFTPVPNANGAAYDNFTFQVRDDGGVAGGGVDIDQSPNTITIDVTSVNDAPEGADNTITMIENQVFTFTDTDFGLTDINDTPANALGSVIISTIPTLGLLELSGVAVTAGQEILAADIPNLTFMPLLNENGNNYDSFTFQVRDDDGTLNGGVDLDATPNEIIFDVISINSQPFGTDNTLSTLEDTPYIFDANDFGFNDPNDIPNDTLQSVIITTLPADGVLELSGTAVTAGQEILLADIPNLSFTPATNDSGNNYTDFTFQVRDTGGTANSGIDTDQIPNIISFDIIPVNDAPDGADITLTTNEDAPLNFTSSDFGFSDINDNPANALQSIIITTLPMNGTLELSGAAVTAGQEIFTSNLSNLTFAPIPNENGLGYATFTFQTRDDGGTANGGIDLDPTPNMVTIDVTPINDAPDGTDNVITTLEDTDYIFSDSDFGLTDNSDVPIDNLASVIITTIPTNGQLLLSGVAVTAGQEITAGDIPSLVFRPDANQNGNGYADFTFQVRDDGGTTNGGVDLDSTPNTITIDVTPVNDAPEGADNTLTTLEDMPLGFTATDFGFSDAIDTPNNNFQSVVITSVPTTGTLELSGVTVTNGQDISVSDLPNLFYVPALNDSGLAADAFTFQVRDDGGTANGGIDTDQSPNTLTIDITPINEAPSGTDNTVTALEDVPYVFTVADFGFTDVDDVPANNLASVIITTLPTDGVIELSGIAITAGQEIAVADLPNLSFTPLANQFGNNYADFTFQVRDDGGTANGGINLDATPNTITIDVTPVNDAPDGTDITLSTLEDTPLSFTAADFGFTDGNDVPANALQSLVISTIPTNGTLDLSGVAVVAGQEIFVSDIPNLIFTPALNDNGLGYDNFTFQVRDDGGTANGGIDLDAIPNTITLDVISVNDAPTGTNTTVTTIEDTPLTFTSSDFGFSDNDDNPANNFNSIIVTTIPTNGTFELSGAPIIAGQIIAVSDIPNIIYTPALNLNGAGSDGFTFQVQDDGGTTNGGIDTDQTPNQITIDVTSVNDAPDGTDNTVSTLEDVGYNFSISDFGLTDSSDTPANNLASVIITTLPINGVLELSGVAVTAGQEILAADIPNLIFTPAANEFGNTYDNFTFQVRDDGGTSNGGIDLDATPNTMTIDVIAVNDAPDGADITLSTLEDTPLSFSASDFGFTDVQDIPSNNFQGINITALPTNGTLTLSGIPVIAGQNITVADIPNLLFSPALNENGVGYDNFSFAVIDDGGTANGGIDTDSIPNVVIIDVTPVNDAPQGTDTTISALEDTDYIFNASDFGFTDINDTPANNLQFVTINTLPTNGTLRLSGVAIASGQTIAVADIPNLSFSPLFNQNGVNYDNFTFQVTDDGGIANGGTDTDVTPNTITIDVASINDAPSGLNTTLTTLEDTPYIFNSADFGFSDTNDNPANNFQSVLITTLPTNGILELSGVAVVTGQEILLTDLPNLTFIPATDENGLAYTNFTFQVKDDGGITNGGVDTNQTPSIITFNVTAVDDAPILNTNNGLTIFEGDTKIISIAELSTTDIDTAPTDIIYTITNPTVNGQVELAGAPGIAITSFTQDDLDNNRIIYAHNGGETTADNFDFTINDAATNIGTSNFAITITPTNDAPVGADNLITFNEDTSYIFNGGDFNFTDRNDTVPNNFQAVRIITLPNNGTLFLAAGSSAPGLITAGQFVSASDIGFLTFTPDANANGVNYGTFTFQVQDDGGTIGTGIDLSDIYTMQLDVSPVNDAPTDINLSQNFLPTGVGTWNVGNLTGVDIDSTNLTYSIVSADPIFSITNGNVLTTNGAKTFGTDPDTYSVTLRVSDGALTYDKTFTINLIPEDVVIENSNPADAFIDNKNNQSSQIDRISAPKLEFYIRDFMKEIQDGSVYRYGNQGLIDLSLSISDDMMKKVFYTNNGIDEIIKRNIIIKLQELGSKILDNTGVDITPEQLADIFGLDVILYNMIPSELSDEVENTQNQNNDTLFETNAIYKALVELNKNQENDEVDIEESDNILEQKNSASRQYLHKQLDEAALYYQSKNATLLKALSKPVD